MRNRLHVLLGIGPLATFAAGCMVGVEAVSADGSFDRSLQVSGPVDLQVRSGSGNIRILAGSPGTVRVVGRIRAYEGFLSEGTPAEAVKEIETNPPILQDGNSVRVGDISDSWLRHLSISYDITVPADTRVRTETGSGNQTIDAFAGPLEARTGSGSIRAERIEGHVKAKAGSGDIELHGAGGGLDASTGSGSIQAEKVSGAVRARAGSGRILIEGRPVEDWSLRTGSGNVTIRVPADAAFELDAQTGSGSIDSRHPIEMLGSLTHHRIRGQVRGGGAHLDAVTGSGSIRIE